MQRFFVFLSRSTLPSSPRGASNTVRRSRLGWPGAMRPHLSVLVQTAKGIGNNVTRPIFCTNSSESLHHSLGP